MYAHPIHLSFLLVWIASPHLLFPVDVPTSFMRWGEINWHLQEETGSQRLEAYRAGMCGVDSILLHRKSSERQPSSSEAEREKPHVYTLIKH